MKLLAGFIFAFIVLALTGVGYIYSGFYNVAAVETHTPLTNWVLNTATRRSVKAQAQAVTPPPEPASQKGGEAFRNFNEMCVQCHGAPGKAPSEIGKGLQPPPPALSVAVRRWERAELFWILKNGIRMTGMPAFGPTHSDEQLWTLVVFLERLPNLSPEEYKEMEQKFGAPPRRHGH